MNKSKYTSLILILFVFLLQSCAINGMANSAAASLVSLPFKIIGVAIAAAIGAASGMGVMPL